jgi:kinesin family protein 18/19
VFDLIDPLFKGYNGCVFAYGPTGTGKTHTMLGNNNVAGLCSLSLRAIFDKRRSMPNHEILINVSYVEIYNEQIRDLLIPNSKENYLDLREDPIKGVSLAGATEFKVDSVDEVMNLLFQGNKRRTTEATNANQTSSRSHAVFQICVNVNPRCKDVNIERVIGKLSLIDLAGSERGTVTENRGLRLREGAKINQSLLALANCINALGDKNKKGSFVPYRDSKLTRMLKDSLGGNCKTVMIVTISPSSTQFEETLNTLKYANRAKNITTKPVENKKLVEFHIAEYKNIIRDLRTEIDSLRLKLKPPTSPEENDNCVYCTCGREQDSIEAERIKQELFENFQERIQIRRGLCELEAQNQLNEMEIKQGQEKLMRYTLSRSGKLIAKENCESNDEYTNLPSNLRKQLSDIKKLKVSMDHNFCKKEIMQKELVFKAEKAQTIMNSISSRIRHQDKKDFLEVVVKNYILQLENDELEYNLKLQEKLNIILVEEIKRLRSVCSSNGVMLSEKEEEEEEDDFGFEIENKPHNNISSVSPQRKFNKKLSSNQSLYEKTKTFEKIENAEKVASEKKMVGSNTELVLPPIKEFNTPKNKVESRLRGQSLKSKELKQEYSKIDQDVRNAINAITSLNNIGTENNLNDRKAKIDLMKKQLKNTKTVKTNSKLPPPRELSIKK